MHKKCRKNKIRLVKGSHIITKKLYKKDVAFTFQNTDKRIIFVIPYKKKFSLIGTTEVEVKSPENKEISKKEIQLLIRDAFRRKDLSKDNQRTTNILGCSVEEFKLYLESKFESWMTWDNKGLYNGEIQSVDGVVGLYDFTKKTDYKIYDLTGNCNFIHKILN